MENFGHDFHGNSGTLMLEQRENRVEMVENICSTILEKNLGYLTYNPTGCRDLAVKLSQIIRNEVNRALSGRYKIVSTVRIGPLQAQGLNITTRCRWRPDTDSSANSVFKNSSIFAVATALNLSREEDLSEALFLSRNEVPILYPYINQDDNIVTDYSDNEQEKQPIKMDKILKNISNFHNNLPHKDKMFRPDAVSSIAEGILREELTDLKYNPWMCRQKSKELSNKIRDAIKDLGFDRYKIVCTVSIGSLGDQGLYMASRCLWFSVTDGSATAVFRNSSLFAVAIVFGVYTE